MEDKGLELIDADTKVVLLPVGHAVEDTERRADFVSLASPLGDFEFKGDSVVERLTAGEDETDAHADGRVVDDRLPLKEGSPLPVADNFGEALGDPLPRSDLDKDGEGDDENDTLVVTLEETQVEGLGEMRGDELVLAETEIDLVVRAEKESENVPVGELTSLCDIVEVAHDETDIDSLEVSVAIRETRGEAEVEGDVLLDAEPFGDLLIVALTRDDFE